MTTAPARARRRRRAAGARRARLPARPRRPRSARCVTARLGDRGAAGAAASATVDAVFLDIQMPGLDGLDLARVLARFRPPPPVVFVTAHDEHAVDAFDLDAVDYVLKPVREERLAEAVRRVVDGAATGRRAGDDEPIPVELGGVTRFVAARDVALRRGPGRLRPAAHRRRQPPGPRPADARSRSAGRDAGFVRIHRSLLVALRARRRGAHGRAAAARVVVGDAELAVSRRHTRELRDLLVRGAGREPGRRR